MIQDELRQKCITVMKKAADKALDEMDIDNPSLDDYRCAIEAAFDALHGLVRVVPVEATEEMIKANGAFSREIIKEIWCGTAVIGDLTRAR